RDLCEDHDLTQQQVAEQLGTNRNQYQLYESGKRSLPLDMLQDLCEIYDVSADYILGLTDDPRRR
ncbi:MAG: helix-turn-helix transcriptional regulator, partial [Clostridia bacterium]|nr:helix-turn-helix transcriptional regulator [Clostridia bacterium]